MSVYVDPWNPEHMIDTHLWPVWNTADDVKRNWQLADCIWQSLMAYEFGLYLFNDMIKKRIFK